MVKSPGERVPPKFVPNRDHTCYTCNQTGHISRNRPQQGRRQEAPGQNKGFPTPYKSSRNAVLESKGPTEMLVSPGHLSVQKLQDLLVQRQLQDEQE